jgi:PEGA domain-containing protein/sigma-54-interacting transcriptional regulator
MRDTCRARHADLNAEPWQAAVAVRLPMLLTGPRNTTDGWIHHMQSRLALPVIEVACDAGVKMTALDDAGTVVLHDVEHLRPADQRRLLRWLDEAPQRPQIISTSSRALYPLVGAGRFSENLYYRLNSVYLDCMNPTIVDLGASSDEGEWIGEFPAEEGVQTAVRLPVASVLPAVLSTGRTRLALTSCAFGVVIGAASMWVVTTQSQSAVVPVASGAARIQEGREQPAPPPQQHDFPAATPQGLSARGVASSRATTGQSEPVTVTRPVQRPAARPRRTVFRGALAVNSRPTGARVSINGQSLGVTPLMVKSLPAGSRVVRLTARGYQPWSSAVRVVANQRNSVIVTLQRLRD